VTESRFKCKSIFTGRAWYFCLILIQIGIFWQILLRSPNIKFEQFLPRGSHPVLSGQVDRRIWQGYSLRESSKKANRNTCVHRIDLKPYVRIYTTHALCHLSVSLQNLCWNCHSDVRTRVKIREALKAFQWNLIQENLKKLHSPKYYWNRSKLTDTFKATTLVSLCVYFQLVLWCLEVTICHRNTAQQKNRFHQILTAAQMKDIFLCTVLLPQWTPSTDQLPCSQISEYFIKTLTLLIPCTVLSSITVLSTH
jgi:hypothetical protein